MPTRFGAIVRAFFVGVGSEFEMEAVVFNDIPGWQKRGAGLYWEEYHKTATNPVTDEPVVARRRRIRTDFDLPKKSEYGEFVRSILRQHQAQRAS